MMPLFAGVRVSGRNTITSFSDQQIMSDQQQLGAGLLMIEAGFFMPVDGPVPIRKSNAADFQIKNSKIRLPSPCINYACSEIQGNYWQKVLGKQH